MAELVQADLSHRLAAELERAGRLLEELAAGLCLDPIVFDRHAGPLQRFDLITQTICEVARILRARGDGQDGVMATRLEAMAARMTGLGGEA